MSEPHDRPQSSYASVHAHGILTVVMYARYVRRHLVGTETKSELLVELLTSWTVMLRSSLDSFNSVRELGR